VIMMMIMMIAGGLSSMPADINILLPEGRFIKNVINYIFFVSKI
jgi:hypothetical protein